METITNLDPQIQTVADRIVAAGNPLHNDQVILQIVEVLAEANTGRAAQKALKAVLQPYFDNMLQLAGLNLSQIKESAVNLNSEITLPVSVSWSVVVESLIGAFEGGGSGYWLHSMQYAHTPSGVFETPLYSDRNFWLSGGRVQLTYDDPEQEESNEEAASQEIGLPQIQQGLLTMSQQDISHFADLILENGDATTDDVFIQHILFGEVIYG